MKNKSGFTLIEVLIALSVFAIGALAIASIQITSGKSNRTGSEITMAINLASDQMETFMALPFDDASLNPDPAVNPHVDSQGKFNLQWVVTDTDLNADGIDDAKLINLTVSWSGYLTGSSESRSVKIDQIKPSI